MDARRKLESNGMRELSDQLKMVPENSRKLLARMVELAYQRKGQAQDRRQNTVYFPELHESCGLDVEAMYETLKPLQSARLIEVEKQYPFEEIALISQGPSGANALAELSRLCERAKISVWDVLVDLRWDALE